MKPRILLVNPAIYDFSAYDFWLKPYGMLRVAGFLRGKADFALFDYLLRSDPRIPQARYRSDRSGRGEFYSERSEKPSVFSNIRRRFKRFRFPRATFGEFLSRENPFDFAWVQTGMTYWYLGVREVIEDLRRFTPRTKIILGGVYATLCAKHARGLGADRVIDGSDLSPLWKFCGLEPNETTLPLWDLYPRLEAGVLKLADGCPFRCTYCSVPQVHPKFHARPLDHSLAEFDFLIRCGAKHVVFYDDALLFQSERILVPFLNQALKHSAQVNFHTPNALNARFITPNLARLMVNAGFKNVYLGFESSAYAWQRKTGGKVYSEELARAVERLLRAGANPQHLHAYIIAGHPTADEQRVEESIRFANKLGIRVMLSEFSPIPGTPDGEYCRRWIDLDEPLNHNKTAFTLVSLGDAEVNRLKNLAAELNHRVLTSKVETTMLSAPRGLPIVRQEASLR
jgi:hypothetical protein